MKHFILTIACIVSFTYLHAQTLYVSNATGNDGNTGTAWNKALKTLSKALQKANHNTSINAILVEKGVYYPAGTSVLTATNKDSSFTITRGGLKIIGGYNPTSHQRYQQDSTIILGNSCNHIFIIAGLLADADSIILDGFTLMGGFANGSGNKVYAGQQISNTRGAAIYICNNANGRKLSIRNCIITNNYANEGGGIYNQHSSPSITNCKFIGNKVNNLGGAAIFNDAGSPQIIGCDFIHNGEGMFGGAFYNTSDSNVKSSPLITNCTFTDNLVDQWGAGIYADGGFFNISNCVFSGNESFATNENSAGGGGIYFIGVTATITNSTFCGNKVANAAGAGIFSEKSFLTIGNCTFSGNYSKYGGALCSRGNQSNIKICNSILYGNSSGIDTYGNGSLVVNHSIVDGGYNGIANYSSDPMFVNAPTFAEAPFSGYKGGYAKYIPYDYNLKAGSLAIDTGNNSFYTTTGGRLTDFDLAGKNRFFGNAIDIGAYEYQPTTNGPATTNLPKAQILGDEMKPANK